MSITFFSVDVETTSTNPFNGQLLTVGIVAIDSKSLEILDTGYWRLDYDINGPIDQETLEWWQRQPDVEVFEEAWSHDKERYSPHRVANELYSFVGRFGENFHERVFCANPVSFDYPWIMKLYAETGMVSPFSYRTLCMRSMYFGIIGGDWGKNRTEDTNWHHSERPHHAGFDAHAQALDLIKMYRMAHPDYRTAELTGVTGDVYD